MLMGGGRSSVITLKITELGPRALDGLPSRERGRRARGDEALADQRQQGADKLSPDSVALPNRSDLDPTAGAVSHDRVVPAAASAQMLEFRVTAETVPAEASQV